jgi:hypothetical protein
MDESQKKVIDGWIKKAESDFTTIRVLLNMKDEPIPFDTVSRLNFMLRGRKHFCRQETE